jgi:phosphoglycerate dehydrogenase-like enzyme
MTTAGSDIVLLVSDNVWQREGTNITSFAPGLTPIIYEGDEPIADDVLADVNVAFFSIMKSTNVKWLHTFSAGVDSPFFIQLMENGVRLSNSSGATASPIAQTAILYMLALSRNARAWFRHQDKREWQRHSFDELDGSRLAVIGLGPIGLEIARLGVALNMEVEGIRRTPQGNEPCPTYGFDALNEVLGRADWVACALPLTPDTKDLFDDERFAAFKAGARFINVGRGELVSEPALIAALQSGHLAGAGLDVFATEPLPEDSPLWNFDNVIVTPHSSGASSTSGLRAEKIFVENLRRYINGEPLRNEVNL